jgi:hypothetical protein
MRSFANICNAGVGEDAMAKVASQACAVARWPTRPRSVHVLPQDVDIRMPFANFNYVQSL